MLEALSLHSMLLEYVPVLVMSPHRCEQRRRLFTSSQSLKGACIVAGAVLPESQLLSDQVSLPTNELSSESSWAVPQLSEGNVTCKFFCNDEELDQSVLQVAGEAKSCVGTFKVSKSVQFASSQLIVEHICTHATWVPFHSAAVWIFPLPCCCCRCSVRAMSQTVLVFLAPSARVRAQCLLKARRLASVRVLSKVLARRASRPQVANSSKAPRHTDAWELPSASTQTAATASATKLA